MISATYFGMIPVPIEHRGIYIYMGNVISENITYGRGVLVSTIFYSLISVHLDGQCIEWPFL